MSEKLFDALEICLQAIEKGETIDSALARFPVLADELRPILETSLRAQALAVADIPSEVQRRGRARLLQHASQMREAKRAPRRRTWIFSFRPVAVTLMLVIFFLSGTGLVRASNGALPGDNLYPVKRTWENVTLAFAPTQKRDELKLTYETERVEEINELLTEGRSETVSFLGYVSQQAEGQWVVAGIRVAVDANTVLPTTPVGVGAAVMVTGQTDAQGAILAQTIVTVAPGSIVPEIESDDHEDENQNGDSGGNDQNQSNDNNDDDENSNSSSGDDADNSNEQEDSKSKLEGILQTVTGTLWVVNGQAVDVSGAEIIGAAIPGANVTVEGYYNAEGVFIATKITFGGGGSDSSGNSNSGNDNGDDNDNDNDNDNSNDDSSNDNTNDDDNNNTNDDNSNNDNNED